MPASLYILELREKIGHMLIMSPGAAAFITNERGEILLQHRSDDLRWGLPGGAVDPGEDPADAVVREVREETNLEVIPERLTGLYSGPEWRHVYPNGDEIMVIGMVFACRVIGGTLAINDDESLELRYFPPDQLPAQLFPRHQQYINDALKGQLTTSFRFQGEYQ